MFELLQFNLKCLPVSLCSMFQLMYVCMYVSIYVCMCVGLYMFDHCFRLELLALTFV